jgi:predicted CXXCH cytochrome family protein
VFESAPRRIRRQGSVWCSACHGPGRIVPPQFRWQYGAKFQVGVCARCHDVEPGDPDANHISPEVREWNVARMSLFTRDLRDDDPALRRECTQCHSAQGFVAFRHGRELPVPDRATVAPITCTSCHDPHDARNPFALRVFDTSDPIAGAQATDLGSGALCASCHRASIAWDSARDAAPHAPQSDVLVGRGARLVPPLENGMHRSIANTCVRCHMTRPAENDRAFGLSGGHTFSVVTLTGEGELSTAACAPCHGSTAPRDIGVRDWNGDGRAQRIVDEQGDSMRTIRERMSRAIVARAIHDACTPARTAASLVDYDARLVLTDASGQILGDCDSDGRLADTETAVTVAALPSRLADAVHDFAMLEKDGSAGVHNPEYAFRILGALQRVFP